MAKGSEKCSPCMLLRHVVHFGNLKMDANEGVQSFNFEVGQKFKSFTQDAKFIQMQFSHSQIMVPIAAHIFAICNI
jgi:hypothetical protein